MQTQTGQKNIIATISHLTQQLRACLSCLLLLLALIAINHSRAAAQGKAFTYQGNLNLSGSPANGTYDLQFKVFDQLTGGTQQDVTMTRTGVTVTDGAFSVELDFGDVFPGAMRFLEIGVKQPAEPSYTLLAPRQKFTSTPYAIRSLNAGSSDSLSAACVGCVTGTQIGSVPAGSGNYIQNSIAQQPASNFHISGNGNAGGTLAGDWVSAKTGYVLGGGLGGDAVLRAPGIGNVFLGDSAGPLPPAVGGSYNLFIGTFTGITNSTMSHFTQGKECL